MYRIVLNETSYYGAGCRSVIADEIRKRGFKKVLLVTDKDLIRFGVAAKIEEVLRGADIPYEIYSQIKANPTIRNVQQGVEAFKASGADCMVALGGGSSIDTAKAVGIIVNNPEFADVRSLEGVADTKHRAVPTFAVPTTAGTAAEVTINYVITDEENRKKMVCVDPNDIPMCAVIDCELMMSMPRGLTAATGMDALTHAIEGYITPGAWTMSDMFELKAIELVAAHLRNAVEDGSDPVARNGMAEAQYIAGMGFSNVGLGIVHSMAHPLGAFYDTPHGVANALLLPYVMEYNEEMVREAINRELARNGQVYYVYNRVTDIDEVAGRVQALVPDAVVTFAHGQVREHELERIMADFINGEIDVLVSTTIIETGLDISNANTMIIHDSDQMGLSQLYQLRGRVGRSNRTSYAFLMYRRNKMLKEVAEKRLHAIREFTEMGSGFKIAMRDLEIRGAGNLLGAEQSGHMESVGYDLYCKMLAEAVQEAKGIAPAEAFETTIDLNVSAYIPDSYISNESLKLDTYKRIAAIENKEEYEDMTEELTDRFGEPPKNVQNLLAVAELKALAHCAYVTELKQMGDSVRVTLQQHAKIDVARIPELLQKYRDELKFQMESLAFVYTPRRRNSKEKIDLLEKSHALVEDLLQITQE